LSVLFFLNPETDQDIADFNRFHSEDIVETLDGCARAPRKSHGTPIILGTYYGGPGSSIKSHKATGYLLTQLSRRMVYTTT
jgi:hypothetical protein